MKVLFSLILAALITTPVYADNECLANITDRVSGSFLSLSHCGLVDEDMPIITTFLHNHPEITFLYMPHNKIKFTGVRVLAAVTTLTHLDISFNPIGRNGARILANNRSLTFLSVQSTKLGESARFFAYNHSLEVLDLTDNQLDADTIKLIANKNYTLKYLGLGYNNVNLDTIQALINNPLLSSLDLSGNDIDDTGATFLASDIHLKNLILDNNLIGDPGAEVLALNTTLETLSITDNQIGKNGLQALLQNKTLKNLWIDGNPGKNVRLHRNRGALNRAASVSARIKKWFYPLANARGSVEA